MTHGCFLFLSFHIALSLNHITCEKRRSYFHFLTVLFIPFPLISRFLLFILHKILGQDGLWIKSDLSGFREGEYWDDRAGGHVKHIAICYEPNDILHSIQTTYERDGVCVMSRRHGGNQGNLEMVTIQEPLTWISGHYGYYCLDPEIFGDEEENPWNYTQVITSLKFGTDRASYGPFGRERGEAFSFKSTGTEIGGFYGCSSNCFLNGIGVYIRSTAVRFIDDKPHAPAASVKVEYNP